MRVLSVRHLPHIAGDAQGEGRPRHALPPRKELVRAAAPGRAPAPAHAAAREEFCDRLCQRRLLGDHQHLWGVITDAEGLRGEQIFPAEMPHTIDAGG